jgi:hypothetical protein
VAANQTVLATGQSPVTAVGNNLFTFLANRLNMSFTNLGCQNFGLTNPVTVTLDGNGVATAATFNTTAQKATSGSSATPPPTNGGGGNGNGNGNGHGNGGRGGHRHGRHGHQLMNPSGM